MPLSFPIICKKKVVRNSFTSLIDAIMFSNNQFKSGEKFKIKIRLLKQRINVSLKYKTKLKNNRKAKKFIKINQKFIIVAKIDF